MVVAVVVRGGNCPLSPTVWSPDAVQVIALLRLSVPWERAGMATTPEGLMP